MQQVEVQFEGLFDLLNLSRDLPSRWRIFRLWLCHKIGRKEHVVESISAKDNLLASGKLIDGVKNLVPGVLRHEKDERV